MLFSNCFLDFISVEEPSLCNKLGKLNWMVENFSPLFNGCDVIVHALASLDGIREHPYHFTDILNTRDKFQVLEIVKSVLNLM